MKLKSLWAVVLPRIVLRLLPERPRWKVVAKGPANITGLRYKFEEVKIQGTYVKEQNQHGEERYWITEPDGTRYMKGPESVIPENNEL
jgi:hypothetical protein